MSEEDLRASCGRLASLRKRPCLLFASDYICPHLLPDLLKALDSAGDVKALDIVIHSPGGDPDTSYVIARELRRKFETVTAFVPRMAKSGATLIALAASEIVLGRFGELGPIDVQTPENQPGEFRDFHSCLERFKALEQLQRHAIETFDLLVSMTLQQGLNVLDACSVAADFTGRLMAPLYSQIKPEKIGQSARNLELSSEYARRILRRYRPEIAEQAQGGLVRALGRGYPTHSFVIDLEELKEIGLNARASEGDEAEILTALDEHLDEEVDFIFTVGPSTPAAAIGSAEAATENSGSGPKGIVP